MPRSPAHALLLVASAAFVAAALVLLTGVRAAAAHPDALALSVQQACAGSPKARAELELLLALGTPRAVHLFGQAALEGRLSTPQRGRSALARAAERGDPVARRLLGKALLVGKPGLPADGAAARALLQQAASQGDAPAAYWLAVSLLSGEGGPQDPRAALPLLQQAAAARIPQAHFLLGNVLRDGLGAPVDLPAALASYRTAAALEHAEALQTLYFATLRGELGLQADPQEAAGLLRELEHALVEPLPLP